MNEWVKIWGLKNNEENKMKGRQLLTKDFIIVSKISGILGHPPKYFCHCSISHVCFISSLDSSLTLCHSFAHMWKQALLFTDCLSGPGDRSLR